MSERYENLGPDSVPLDAVDDDPPRESEQFREFDKLREPDDDDDPPVERRSPWDEVEPGAEQFARRRADVGSAADDEDPPSEPRSVRSIARAPMGRLEQAARRRTAQRVRSDERR
jgi:hypothetical protein